MAKPKLDAVTAGAVDLARAAAVETGGEDAVGEHQDVVAEGDRVVTHTYQCLLPGYADWQWAVTLVRASRAKEPTVNEVVLLPTPGALLAPEWVPWADRIGPGDIAPGTLMATPDNDPRLEPGFAATDLPADSDSSEWVQLRSTVAELGWSNSRTTSGEKFVIDDCGQSIDEKRSPACQSRRPTKSKPEPSARLRWSPVVPPASRFRMSSSILARRLRSTYDVAAGAWI